MFKVKFLTFFVLLALLLAACQPGEPSVVEREVTRVVTETVIQEVQVAGETVVQEVEVTRIVTELEEVMVETAAEKHLFGFSQAHNGHPWRVNQTANVRDYWAENLTAEVNMLFTDAQNKPEKQVADVEDLLARGIDCLIITPVVADALTPIAKQAMDQGIPVITLDREVNTPVTLHIGADNKQIGRAAAKYIAETLLNGSGNIIEIQGTLGASATIDRNVEFMEELKNYPGVQVIASQTADYSREPALKFMEDMLQRFGPGEFQVVYAHNDEMALGAIEALKAAGRLDEVFVVGIDGQNEAFDAIKAGDMTATFTYLNGGKEGVEYAYRIMKGETFPTGLLILDSVQVDSTNIDEWVDKGF